MSDHKWTVGRIQELRADKGIRAPLQPQSLAGRLREHEPIMKLAADVSAENEQLKAEVERLKSENDHLRLRYETHCGYWDGPLMKIADAAVAYAIADSAESKLVRMTPPDWRDEDARLIGIHACNLLISAEEAAREALVQAVREYRKLTEVEG